MPCGGTISCPFRLLWKLSPFWTTQRRKSLRRTPGSNRRHSLPDTTTNDFRHLVSVQNRSLAGLKAPAGEDSSRTSPGCSVRTLSHTLLARVLAPSLTNPQITRLPDAGITVRATAPAQHVNDTFIMIYKGWPIRDD